MLALLLSVIACRAHAAATLTTAIAPQSLSEALVKFARETSLELVYESKLAYGQTTRGAPAGLAAADALARLLEGTGLRYEFLSSRTVRLVAIEGAGATAGPPAREAGRRRPSAAPLAPQFQEILITATKRSESLAVVPMSVSVLSADDMATMGVRGIEQISALTPGVEYDYSSQYGSGILTNIAIRGIAAGNGLSTTGLYIDDAPINVRHTPFANPYPVTFDLQRVEVLRGPQGTLFGTGAEGGAIRFITTEPSTVASGGLLRSEFSATETGGLSYEAGAAAGGPIVVGLLGARASAWYRRDGGYVDRIDPFTGRTVSDDSNRGTSRAFRFAANFAPSEALQIIPSFAYQSISMHDSPVFYTYLSDPDGGLLLNGKLLRQPASDSFSVGALKIVADFPGTTLTAASSYFDRTANATVDQTNAAGLLFYGGFGNPLGPAYPSSYSNAVATVLGAHQILLSQEIRIASRDSTAPLTWLAGVFYSRTRQEATHTTYAVTAPQDIGIYSDDYNLDTNRAAFGEFALKLAPRWRVSLGARFGKISSDSTRRASGFANSEPPFQQSFTDESYPLAPRFGVSYQRDERNLLYATVAKGFRGGGPNGTAPPRCGAPAQYGPDWVWSYEAGAKNRLFDERLQLATSVFYIRWNGIQQNVVDPCGDGYTANVGAATSTGFDVTAEARLTEHLRVGLAAGFDDAHYTRTLRVGQDVTVASGTVVESLPAVSAPWNGVASAEYRVALSARVTAFLRAEDIVTSRNSGPFIERDPRSSSYDPTARADPATNRLNLHLGLIRSGTRLELSAFNALNSQPVLQYEPDGLGSTLNYAYTFRPRTVALTATQQF